MTILLLDAYNLLFRSFTSLPPAIVDGEGHPINAVYGMLAFTLRLLRELEPTGVVAAFDVPDVPTFRHEIYDRYQAQRGPLGGDDAPEFARQVAIAVEVLPQLGVPAVMRPGFEADDMMGTIASGVSAQGGHAVLISTDRDLLQLVRPGIEIVVPGKELKFVRNEDDVRARLGVPPAGVTAYKALAGDASDNIPGLPGIGPKTAARLIEDYGTLEGIFANIADVPPRLARILDAGRDDALLFQRVATIVTDLDTGLDTGRLPAPQFSAEDRPRALLNRTAYGPAETESKDEAS
jgi:DNA polymerase-1